MSRFSEWVEACNNPRIQKLDAVSVHKRYRICRRHFDSDCLNGGCRRLLNTAIPTLYLNQSPVKLKTKPPPNINQIDMITKPIQIEDITYLPVKHEDNPNEHFELIISKREKTPVNIPTIPGKII